MKLAVEQKQTVTPDGWINWALELNILWQDLKHELTKAEILYKREIARLQEEDTKLSNSKAEIRVQAREIIGEEKMTSYELYRYLKGRDEIVAEFIKLAKKRSTIEKTYEY